ncbi:MAG: hypothetical protein HOZ81_05155 [Streptomyces sp.]|nr:hypothetical protein [Streptomyces sp.]
MFSRRPQQSVRDREIAGYVSALRRHNGGGMGIADVARLARQDGRNYSYSEVSRVMGAMRRREL